MKKKVLYLNYFGMVSLYEIHDANKVTQMLKNNNKDNTLETISSLSENKSISHLEDCEFSNNSDDYSDTYDIAIEVVINAKD